MSVEGIVTFFFLCKKFTFVSLKFICTLIHDLEACLLEYKSIK